MAVKTTTWDSAEYLKTDEDVRLYLDACLEEAGDDPEMIAHAFCVVARAKAAGLNQENPPWPLPTDGDLSFVAAAKIAKAIGLKLSIERPA